MYAIMPSAIKSSEANSMPIETNADADNITTTALASIAVLIIPKKKVAIALSVSLYSDETMTMFEGANGLSLSSSQKLTYSPCGEPPAVAFPPARNEPSFERSK